MIFKSFFTLCTGFELEKNFKFTSGRSVTIKELVFTSGERSGFYRGYIYLVIDTKSNKPYALKRIPPKYNMSNHDITALRKLQRDYLHPFIIHLIDSDSRDHLIKDAIALIDYFPSGDLWTYVRDHPEKVIKQAALIASQLVSALAFVHSYKIIHRDLKLENILCKFDPQMNITKAVITDFGFAKKLEDVNRISNHTVCGTPTYMAPEQFHGKYNIKSDIWSLGILIYSIVHGQKPIQLQKVSNSDSLRSIYYILKKIEFYFFCSEEAKNFLRRMLVKNPSERASAEELLSDPWIISHVCKHEKPVKFETAEFIEDESEPNDLTPEGCGGCYCM